MNQKNPLNFKYDTPDGKSCVIQNRPYNMYLTGLGVCLNWEVSLYIDAAEGGS